MGVDPNWGILGSPGNGLAQGLALGKQFREQRQQNALLDIRRQEMEQRQSRDAAEAAQKRQTQRNTQTQQLGRLLDHATDETTYQQSLAAARQLGLDVSQVPQSYDPAWVNQQKLVLQAFDKDGGQQLSGLARELQDAGYQQGTPEFAAAMRTALQGKYAPQYTDDEGNIRQGQLPALPGTASASPRPSAPAALGQDGAFTFDMYQGAVNGLGEQGAREWLGRQGLAVSVQTPEQARQLPSGTRIILPDGSEGRVP